MNQVSDAIVYALDQGGAPLAGSVLVMLAADTKLASRVPGAVVWNPYAHQASLWSQAGHRVLEDLNDAEKYQTIILFCPKQKDETLHLMARALDLLERDGVLICAAENQAGGQSLAKYLSSLDVNTSSASKHKCRVVWGQQPGVPFHRVARQKAIEQGAQQNRADGLISQPGLFSWAQTDKGTDFLLHHLPFSLAGIGADFGCGIGVLGVKLLQRYSNVQRLYCIDHDSRAVACCRANLAQWAGKCDFMWADIQRLPLLPPLDFIVMNPPFHQGKQESNLLGQNFISAAAAHLKPGGVLVFVANAHLPYEALLPQLFSMHRLVSETDGYKIIEAIK